MIRRDSQQALLDHARYYVSKGISIIPLKHKDKKPAISSWKEFQERLPTDEELVQWFGNGSKYNIGAITGKVSGIVAVDLDTTEAVEYAKEHNFPISPLSKTGKGYHIIYRYKDGVRNFQKRDDLPGIDLRGDGGYIAVAPSVHPSGHVYQWVEGKGLDDLPLAELPEIILARKPEDKTPLRDLYKGTDRGSRNDALARLAGSWVNDGLTVDEMIEQAKAVNSNNKPPLSEKEIEQTVRSIFEKHHRNNTTLNRIVEERELLSFLLKWNDILLLDVRTSYILDKIIPKGSITLIFGRGGIGKTSLMMQIGKAIAGGSPFGNLQTIKTPVYYVDFENPLSVLKERVEKIGKSENLYVWHISNEIQPPKLDSKEWDLYKQLPPGLIIFDTLRASNLSDENNSKDMNLIMGRLKELRELGFTIILLHHTPKGNDATFKGSTAILDLCDHVISLEEVKNPEEENIEFDSQNLYKLGTRIKTRYEPHHIFLTFKPELKGFSVAVDPDIEYLEIIREILNDSSELLKQKDLRKKGVEQTDKTDREVRRLLSKGIGIYWDTIKGENNATLYVPINSVCQFVTPLTPRQTDNQELSSSEKLTNRPISSIPGMPVNTEFGSLSGASEQTEKQAIIDLTGDDIEILP